MYKSKEELGTFNIDAEFMYFSCFFDVNVRQKESKEINVHTTNGKWRITQELTLHLHGSISATAGLSRDALRSETTKSRAAGG